VSFEIIGIVYDRNRAIVQTKTTLTKQDGTSVTPYFSMGFRSVSGELKIDLHHSSLPPTTATTTSNTNTDSNNNDNDSNNVSDRLSVAAIVIAVVGIMLAVGALITFLLLSERFKKKLAEEDSRVVADMPVVYKDVPV
jgi:hypothetical protein